jgi:hypothetical protein
MNEYLKFFIKFLPQIFFVLFFVFGLYKYYSLNKEKIDYGEKEFRFQRLFKKLIAATFIFRFIYSSSFTFLQYLIWKGDSFSSLFLELKLSKLSQGVSGYLPAFFEQKGSYFIYYSFYRFWLEFFIAFLLSIFFFTFFESLRKKNERFLSKSDSLLAFWGGLMSGWPYFVVYKVSFLLSFLFYGLWRKKKGKIYTPLTEPLFVGIGVALSLGYLIIKVLNLDFLILFNF